MMTELLHKRIILFTCIILVTGCMGGGSNTVQYFLIDPVVYDNQLVPKLDGLNLEIIDVNIPQYLEKFHIATRSKENRLSFSDTHQWGGNLRKNLLTTMVGNLSKLLSINDISTPLNRSLSIPDLRLQVDIERFERDVDGKIKLNTRWQLSDNTDSINITVHSIELESSDSTEPNNYDQIVSSMQNLYGDLAENIAETILEMEIAGEVTGRE